jgi:hypothetical protein
LKDVEKEPVWNKSYESDVMKKSHSRESVPCFMYWGCTVLIDKDMMVLQNHTNSEMDVQDPSGETNPTSHDASQAIIMKVEEVSDAEEEAGPVQISFPKIKSE